MNCEITPAEVVAQAPDYAKLDWYYEQHHRRFRARVEQRRPRLICQECRGGGGWTEPILDDGTGPWEPCGWCESTGYVTPWVRGLWLREQPRKRLLEKGNGECRRE